MAELGKASRVLKFILSRALVKIGVGLSVPLGSGGGSTYLYFGGDVPPRPSNLTPFSDSKALFSTSLF